MILRWPARGCGCSMSDLQVWSAHRTAGDTGAKSSSALLSHHCTIMVKPASVAYSSAVSNKSKPPLPPGTVGGTKGPKPPAPARAFVKLTVQKLCPSPSKPQEIGVTGPTVPTLPSPPPQAYLPKQSPLERMAWLAIARHLPSPMNETVAVRSDKRSL